MKSKIALIPLTIAVVMLSYIVLVPGTPQEQLVGTPAEVAESIVRQYHETHIYSEYDLFVCSDMALGVWNMLKAQGISALIQVGNVEEEIQDVSKANHAWVLAETSPGEYLALETTSGYAVWDNPLYYKGWSFHNPRKFKRYVELRHEYNIRADLVERYGAAYDLLNATVPALEDEFETSYSKLAGTPCTDPSFGYKLTEVIEIGVEIGICHGKAEQLVELMDEELRRLENIVHEMNGLLS